jgi:cell wall-associated NlpC family hydrolase
MAYRWPWRIAAVHRPSRLLAPHRLRPSRTSQPNTRTVIKYNRRTNTNHDLVSTRPSCQSQVTGYASSSEAVQARYAAGGTQAVSAAGSPQCRQAALVPQPSGMAGKVIAYAEAQIGKPYLWGATGPDAFDCSGLAMMAYRAAGITIPRTSQQQWAAGPRVPASQARPGDLVFFAGTDGTRAAPGHVGILTGKNQMIDAP